MKFFVIYSFDIPSSETVKRYLPTKRHKWEMTERDEQYEYSYLEGEWSRGKHRKFTALLSRQDFEAFIYDQAMFAEETETMGSLMGFGWLPAISFRADADVIQDAYVTPIPDFEPVSERDQNRDWERLREAILARYGNHGSGLDLVRNPESRTGFSTWEEAYAK